MKIVYYTDQIYLHGGIERVLANKVNYWVNETGYEIHVITTEQSGKIPCYKIDDKVKLHDLSINYNRKKRYINPVNLIKISTHFFKLKKKIREIKPDVIVVCNFAFGFYFMPFLCKNIKIIKEFHSSRHFDFINRINNKSIFKKILYILNDYIESKYDYLVVLTKDELNYYNSHNTVVIPNSLSNFPKKSALLDANKVISAGRIAPVKGYENLIKAWSVVVKTNSNWTLDIFGEGETEYIKSLQSLISQLGLQHKVNLCGSTNCLEDKMLDASVFAMTSLTECFPMVLLESLSCGLPIVSFDCPHGPRNIISNDKDGLLVDNQNIDKFSEALKKLLNNEELRKKMGRTARENSKRFSPELIMKDWKTIFKNQSHAV